MKSRFFCIHGHFYQPPRENPVLGRVEMQPSARPAHDWNERVHMECYGPNGTSRLLDEKGRIRDIWNNYAWMSFNAGATLLAWMEEEHPDAYSRLLEGDAQSRERLAGHGNAMAQVYNHAIMPLATQEDKRLQIAWGLRDFEQRFGRKAEGIWLAETAIDMDTVVELIRAGVHYTVLAPTQAWKVRPLGGEIWRDVSEGNIDPKHPYRIFPLDEDGTPLEKGYLDLFFYDGPLSSGVGFEHLLKDAQRFYDRISGAFDLERTEPQLVSICTDGESYGHHEPFGDMCAAYLFKELAPRQGMIPVNYGYWLSKHPPHHEVRIKNAYSGGTAWSCAHGTGRWSYDCGCSTGAPPGWNQKWRAPLRQALDWLSHEASAWFERDGNKVFRDWERAKLEACDSWYLNTDLREAFWLRHLDPTADASLAMDLMEALRFQQYMFTSCGWFFADLTGIETVQVLRYAQRLLSLYESHNQALDTREGFLALLAQAESNLNAIRGDTLFAQFEAEHFEPENYVAFADWMKSLDAQAFRMASVLGWKLKSQAFEPSGEYLLREVVAEREFSRQTRRCWLAVPSDGLQSAPLYLRHPQEGEYLRDEVRKEFSPQRWSAWRQLTPQALPIDVRDRLTQHLRNRYWQESSIDFLAQENKIRRYLGQFQKLDWPIPKNMQAILHVIENHSLVEALTKGLAEDDVEGMDKACALAHRLAAQSVKVHLGPIKESLHQYMLNLGHRFLDHSTGLELKPLFVLLDLLDTLKLNMERSRLENLAFPLFRAVLNWAKTGHFGYPAQLEEALALLDRLNFSTDAGKEALLSTKAVGP